MRIFLCDLKKVIMNSGFYVAPIMVFLLCFTSNIYTDSTTGRIYTVFEALIGLDRDFICSNDVFASVEVFRVAFSGYITMFMPIIAAFPFMITFCTERNSGYMRFQISRTGNMKYCFSKFLSSIISGGLVVQIGIIAYGVAVWILFPALSEYGLSSDEIKMIVPDGEMSVVLRMFITAFIYGAVSTLPATLIASFSRNPYLITCIPFMLEYIRDTGLNKALNTAIEKKDYNAVIRYQPYTSSAITTFVSPQNSAIYMRTFVVIGIEAGIVLLGFISFMRLRKDKGV